MNNHKSFYILDSLARILIGTATSVGVGFFLIPGHFALKPGNGAFAFLVFGFGSALVYAIFKTKGRRAAIGAAFLIGLVSAALFNRFFVEILVLGISAPIALVFLCETLTRLHITKPRIGRLILLAPIYTILGLVVSPLGALTSQAAAHWTIFVRSATLQMFGTGIGLGLGLEAAEYAISCWRQRHSSVDDLAGHAGNQ